MSTFGKITLSFGPTGNPGEEPVSFPVRPINLVVGPNNSGKSLFLRELSGINPRKHLSSRGYSRRRAENSLDVKTSAIVKMVTWPDEELTSYREEIVANVLSPSQAEKKWPSGIPIQPWEELVPKLEEAANELEAMRTSLSSQLERILASNSTPEVKKLSVIAKHLDKGDDLPATLTLATLMFTYKKHEYRKVDTQARELPSEGDSDNPPQFFTELEELLRSYWTNCLSIADGLGLPLPTLTFDELTDLQLLFEAFASIMFAQDSPWLELVDDPEKLPAATRPSKSVPDITRAIELARSFFNPTGYRELARCLREEERESSWENPSMRQKRMSAYLYLDGLTRLAMTEGGQLSSFDDPDNDSPPVLALLKCEENRKFLRSVVAEVLGAQLVIDMVTSAPDVDWRLAKEAPPDGLETRYEEETRNFMSDAALLEDRSDGIHAIVGMFAAILAKAPKVVFIDEPEAFLHPPLVRKFARVIGRIANDKNMQFFIATHSPDLLAGFAPQAHDINILRLSYDERPSTPVATARLLHQKALRRLALDPLLRSESTMSALFAEGAVVCEAPADRTLYREINTRLLNYTASDGVDSCAFLNAQNWQTVGRMIRPLREMGVAAAAIVDADVLFDKDLSKILIAAQIPDGVRDGLLQARGRLKTSVQNRIAEARRLSDEDRKKVKLKHDVISTLSHDERGTFEYLLHALARYGIFVVPLGELECWLAPLGLSPRDKAKWFRDALEALGWDPDADGYAKPQDEDIWSFMREVGKWISSPSRVGTAPPQ